MKKRRHQRKRPNPLKRGPNGKFPADMIPALTEFVKDQLALQILKQSGLRDAFIGLVAPFRKPEDAEGETIQ